MLFRCQFMAPQQFFQKFSFHSENILWFEQRGRMRGTERVKYTIIKITKLISNKINYKNNSNDE